MPNGPPKYAPAYASPKVWKSLLLSLREIETLYHFKKRLKANLSLYSLYYAEACKAFAGPICASLRLGNTALFEKMSQRWRAVGNIVSDLIDPRVEPQTSRSRDEQVTARPNGWSSQKVDSSSSCSRIYSSVKHTRKSIIGLVQLMTQYKGIRVVLIEQEAPNNLAVFKVKVLPVNVHA